MTRWSVTVALRAKDQCDGPSESSGFPDTKPDWLDHPAGQRQPFGSR